MFYTKCRTLLAGCLWGKSKYPYNFQESSCIDIKEIIFSLSEFRLLNGENYLKKSCQDLQMTLIPLLLWNQVICPELHNFYNNLFMQVIQLTI